MRNSIVKYLPSPRILNNKDNKEEEENKNWRLTSRMFLVDSIGGETPGSGSLAGVVRYLASLELRVTLLNTRESPDRPGRIHPPLAVLR